MAPAQASANRKACAVASGLRQGRQPLNLTDPSGYCFLGCFWKRIFAAIQNLFRSVPLIGTIVQIAAGVPCAGPLAPVCVGLAAPPVTGSGIAQAPRDRLRLCFARNSQAVAPGVVRPRLWQDSAISAVVGWATL
jgi:hypothetical protein